MSCEDIGPRLVDHVYGEGSSADEERILEHVSDCPACRARLEELEESRRALDALDGEGTAVDLQRVYRGAARRSERLARRWRLAGAAAIAACVLSGALVLLRTDVEWRPDHVMVRWAPSNGADERLASARELEASLAAQSARIEALEDLARVLVKEIETSGKSRQGVLSELELKLAALERRSAERLERLDRDLKAIYVTQYVERQ